VGTKGRGQTALHITRRGSSKDMGLMGRFERGGGRRRELTWSWGVEFAGLG